MIIPGSWIFAAIVNIPLFLAKNTTIKKGRVMCVPTWPKAWMKAFIMILTVVVGVSLVLMITLYSRVVYTLWFQRKDEHKLNTQQKVGMVPRELVVDCLFQLALKRSGVYLILHQRNDSILWALLFASSEKSFPLE